MHFLPNDLRKDIIIFTDQDYVVWIKLHHPEFDLVSILDCLDVSPLQELNSPSG